MKKLLNSLLSFCLLQVAAAQSFSLNLQQLTNVSFQRPSFIGKIGDQYAIIDLPDASGTPLYFLSSSLKITKEQKLPRGAYYGFRINHEKGMSIGWLEKQNDTTRLKHILLQEDEDAYPVESLDLPKLSGQTGLLANRTGSIYLYYSLQSDGKNHLVIRGSRVNDSLKISANIEAVIDFDAALERFVGPLLDAAGNIHFVVYDKLSNYRESASVRISTISSSRKEILEESFHLDKVKLYDLLLFDNPISKQLQLSGFFYDGASKVISGIASLQFPYDRVDKLNPIFYRFTLEQRTYLASGMENVKKHDDVFEYLKLRGIYEDDGNVLLGAWMLDIPNYKVVKDREYEQHQNTDTALWVRAGRTGLPGQPEMLQSRGDVSHIPAYPQTSSIVPDTRGSSWGNQQTATTPAYQLNTPSSRESPRGQEKRLTNNATRSIPSMADPEKFVFFSIGQNAKFEWMQIAPGPMPLRSITTHNTLPNHAFFDNGQWRISFYEPVQQESNKKTSPALSLNMASIGRTGIQKDPLLNAKPGQYYFSDVWKINDSQYISAYKDAVTGQSGIAMLALKSFDTAKQ
jgi:hypothetical protein